MFCGNRIKNEALVIAFNYQKVEATIADLTKLEKQKSVSKNTLVKFL